MLCRRSSKRTKALDAGSVARVKSVDFVKTLYVVFYATPPLEPAPGPGFINEFME